MHAVTILGTCDADHFILLYTHHRSPWTSHPPHTLHIQNTHHISLTTCTYSTFHLIHTSHHPLTHIPPHSSHTYHPTHISHHTPYTSRLTPYTSHHTPYTQTGSWERSWWKFQSHVNLRCWHCKISGVCGQISETPATSRVPGRDPLPKHNWQDKLKQWFHNKSGFARKKVSVQKQSESLHQTSPFLWGAPAPLWQLSGRGGWKGRWGKGRVEWPKKHSTCISQPASAATVIC